MKLLVCSIHSCIQHHLYSNTGRDMDQTVSRLLHTLLVAYQPTVSIIPRNNIHHRMHANVCSECRGWWSPLVSIHDDDVFVIKHTRRGGGAITTTTTIMMMRTTTSTTTTTLCPKSTWTQIKWSQIHLNVLISSKFPYFASTPTCKAQL